MGRDPNTLVDLTTGRTAFEASLIAEALRERGIDAQAFTLAGSTLQWEVASTQPMRVQVPRGQLDAARAVLAEVRADAAELDWDAVDTGGAAEMREAEREVVGGNRCRQCGYDLEGLGERPTRCPECGVNLAGTGTETGAGMGMGMGTEAVRATPNPPRASKVQRALVVLIVLGVMLVVARMLMGITGATDMNVMPDHPPTEAPADPVAWRCFPQG